MSVVPHRLLPWLVVWTAVTALACTETKVVTVEYTVEQTGLVPAPRGPHAAGPLLEGGQVSLEGAYVGNAVFDSEKSRYEGESGSVVVNHAGVARFGVGVSDSFELGFDAEMASTEWGVSVPSDTDANDVDASVMFRLGVQGRGYVVGNNERGFGFLGGLSVGSLPYYRGVYERRFLTTWTYEGDPAWWKFPEAKTTLLGERTVTQQDTEFYPFARLGMFGSIGLIPDLTLQLGILGQNQPEFFGSAVLSKTCAQYADAPSACYGEDPDDLDPLETEWLGTVFASLSYQLGMVVFTGQVFGHPLASDYDVVAASPFGGDLGVRLVF